MKKMLVIVVFVIGLVSSLSAGECSDSSYKYYNGHRSVYPSDTFDKNIAQNVKVCINSDVNSLWTIAVKKAVNSLNYNLDVLNTSLHYSYGLGNCIIKVDVSDELPSNRFAQIEPFSGKLKKGKIKLSINIDSNNLKMNKMKSIIMHELLHGVGIFHTGHKVAYEVPNTDGYFDTKYAGRSIMCSVYEYPQSHFNFLDQRTIEFLYPE